MNLLRLKQCWLTSSQPVLARVCCRQLFATWEDAVSEQVKFVLDEEQIPQTWYNLSADLPKPLPPVLHPGTKQPVGPGDLEPLFPMALILQVVTAERYVDIH